MSIDPRNKPSPLAPLADAYEPTDADADRLFAKIQASIAQGGSASATSLERSSGAAGFGGKKALVFGLSCVAVAVAGASAFYGSREDATAQVAAPVASHAAALEAATPSELDTAEPHSTRSHEGSTSALPAVSVDTLPTAMVAERPAASAKRSAPAAAPTTANDALAREARLLANARRALQSGEADRALALLDEHARTFPNGWLASDRAAERIVVLCSLGRRDEAHREAKVFLDGRPKSPLTRRVEMSCAGQP